VKSTEAPGGIGEAGTAIVAPGSGRNAIFAATGKAHPHRFLSSILWSRSNPVLMAQCPPAAALAPTLDMRVGAGVRSG